MGQKIYKIWATIEQHDAETDEYEDQGEEVPLGTFDSYEEANAFLTRLSSDGQGAGDV